ncbi:unnamed protein product [Arctogadus glacialis]
MPAVWVDTDGARVQHCSPENRFVLLSTLSWTALADGEEEEEEEEEKGGGCGCLSTLLLDSLAYVERGGGGGVGRAQQLAPTGSSARSLPVEVMTCKLAWPQKAFWKQPLLEAASALLEDEFTEQPPATFRLIENPSRYEYAMWERPPVGPDDLRPLIVSPERNLLNHLHIFACSDTGNLKDGSRLCAAIEADIMFSLSPAIVLFRKIPVYRDAGLVQSERSPPAEVTVSSPLTACGSKGICLSLSLLPASDLNSKAAEGGRAACVMCKHIAHSVRWGRVWLHRPDDVVSLRQGLWVRIPPTVRISRSLPPRCLLAASSPRPPFTADATETLRSSRWWAIADEAPIDEENRENTSPRRHRSPVKTPPLKGSSKDRN